MASNDSPPWPELSQSEQTRYSRHLSLPEVGLDGQKLLKASRILVVGMGGLGSPACMYLAAAGVGTLGLVDFDNVELSNLQRQILHSTADVGSPKLNSAERRLAEINPETKIVTHEERLTAKNALAIISNYDIVIDGTDNFSTRYLINDACVLLKRINVYGSIYRFEGQASVFAPGTGPCYRCLFPDPPPPDAVPNCAEGGVLGVMAGTIGVLQSTEAIKCVLGLGNTLVGRLLLYDALAMRFDILKISRKSSCAVCGDAPTITELTETRYQCGPLTADHDQSQISAKDLQERLLRSTPVVIIDVRNEDEFKLNRIEGSLLIPLSELPQRIDELDPASEIVVYCQSGARSAQAMRLLKTNSFNNVKSLSGGLLAWTTESGSKI